VKALAPPPPASGAAPAVVTVLARAPTGNRLAAGYSDGAVRAAAARSGVRRMREPWAAAAPTARRTSR
jgi:hypothetical protein